MLRVQCPIDATDNFIMQRDRHNENNFNKPIYQVGDWSLYLEAPKKEPAIERASRSKMPHVYYLYTPIKMFTVQVFETSFRNAAGKIVNTSNHKYDQRIVVTIHFANGYKYRMSYFCKLTLSEVTNYTKIMEGNLVTEAEEHEGDRIQDFGELHGDWMKYLFQSTNNETVNDPKERVEA